MIGIIFLTLIGLNLATGQSTGLTPPYTCTTTVCQPGQTAENGLVSTLTQGKPGKKGPVGEKGQKGGPCECDIVDENVISALREEWQEMKEDFQTVHNRLKNLEDAVANLPENCSSYMATIDHGSATYNVIPIYPLKFIGDLTPSMINCNEILKAGKDGWMSIQRRIDGGTDFYRNWESYARGFGDWNGEFWIGLRRLHLMTTRENCKLKVDFRDWDKSTRYAEYTTFRIGDEASDFRLTVSGYSGTIQDSMAHHNNRRFSTFDRDNDDHTTVHCVRDYKGAWWHGRCHDSNLNGQYFKTKSTSNTGVWWDGFSSSLPYVEMKLFCS